MSAPSTQAASQQVLRGHVPAATKRLSPLRRLNGGTQMRLTIGLPLRNREQLTNWLQQVYDPASPNFRHFLSADEFASSFGPSQEDYQAVIDFAKSHGLTVKATHPNRTLVDVTGAVADVENAFHVHMQVYQHPTEARTFFAPDAEPTLDLSTPVLAISGLDNYVKPRPRIHRVGASLPSTGGTRGLGGGGGGFGGPFDGSDFRNAYIPNVSQNGGGQSIGLFELFTYSDQDIKDYEDEVGMPYVNVQPIYIDGAVQDDTTVDWTTYPGYLDYSFEVTGDIEVAISMAPGVSSVLVYEGPTPMDEPPMGTNYTQDATTTAQINDVFNRMATDNLAKQLSCSYGVDINLSTVQIFQQYAAQGQSFFLASGDLGAYSGAIYEPADDPYITVVGGTTLTTTSSGGSWSSETTWLTPAGTDGLGNPTPLQASGGGISTVYAIPSWQQGISMTANQGSTTMRNIPDVAAVANNINIVWGNDFIGASSDWTEGGTSLAAPQWAGFLALVNQQGATNGQPPVGFVNPALYAIGKSASYHSCFHDITTGSNTNNSSPTKYHAVAGYDLCTGWGTINTNLFNALLSPPVESLQITSPLGFTAQGPSGGPFSTNTQAYTLTNTGSTPLTWSAASDSSWLTVSSAGGTLNPGASAAVTVSLNSGANNLMLAHASGNVAFHNLTAGTTQNRQFDLYAGNGGFETGGLDYWTYVGDPTYTFALADDDDVTAGEAVQPPYPDSVFVHSGIYGAYLGEYPDNGTLSQTIPTRAGQKLLFSFWLTSICTQSDTTPNGFAAKWNGTTLFTGTNLAVFGWTNLQYIVSTTGSSSTLEFDFNNTPGAFGLDDVTVTPIPAPVFQAVSVTNHSLNFTWNTIPNTSYQIQSANNIGNFNWSNVGAPIMATGNVMSVSEPVGTASQQFYRVIMLQNP